MRFLGYPIYVNHPSPGWAAASIQNHQPTINSLYGKSVDFFLGVSEKKINILESQGWCASGNSKVSNDSIYIYCIYIYIHIYIFIYLYLSAKKNPEESSVNIPAPQCSAPLLTFDFAEIG